MFGPLIGTSMERQFRKELKQKLLSEVLTKLKLGAPENPSQMEIEVVSEQFTVDQCNSRQASRPWQPLIEVATTDFFRLKAGFSMDICLDLPRTYL